MLVFLIVALTAYGCVTSGVNPLGNRTTLDKGAVLVKVLPSSKEYVSRVYVYQEGNEMVVAGGVKTRRFAVLANGGHVDVVVIAPDGALIDQRSISHSPFRRKGNPEPSFKTRIPLVPQPGTTVRLAYHHPSQAMVANAFDCGQNAAAPKAGT
jgi:hypothetical protein